jgi:hypothetical protein
VMYSNLTSSFRNGKASWYRIVVREAKVRDKGTQKCCSYAPGHVNT